MDPGNLYDSEGAENAINKGIQHLLSLMVNNRWKGFPTLAGQSDIWVTAFVLTHIFHLCKQKEALKRSQNFLLASQHPSGGWSYSNQVPPDADSTSWCLMALQSHKEFNVDAIEEAKAFLWSHFTNDSLSTYTAESGIREFISAPGLETIAGWTAAHPDVSIAAVLAAIQNDKVPQVMNWLLARQAREGLINSYWWRGPYYTTTLFLRALTKLKLRLPQEQAKKIAEALVHEQKVNGGFVLGSSENTDAFTTGLALESFINLSYPGLHQQINKCANALLLSQNENGGWAGNFILRIPAPFITDPNQVASWNNGGGGNSFVEDGEGIFATAMACHALDCWRKRETQNDQSKEWPVIQIKNVAKGIDPKIKTNTV